MEATDSTGKDERRGSTLSRLAAFMILSLVVGAAVGYEIGASTAVPATRTITATQLTTTIGSDTTVNGSLKVVLGQNSTVALVNSAWDGGYLWLVTKVSNPSVVQPVANSTYVPPHNATLVGGPAETQIFTFKALKAGNATVMLELVRPWQMNEPVSRYVLSVVVVG